MIRYITFLILFCIGGNASAQTLIDAIIAVVNDDAITRSELEDEFRIAVLVGIRTDMPPTVVEKRAALNTIINRKFALQEAERLGIAVTERDSQVTVKMAEISAKYASDTAFQSALQRYQLERACLEAWIYEQLIYNEFFRRIFFYTVNSEKVAKLAKSYYDANRAQYEKTYEEVSEEITERIRQELANEQFETWLTKQKEEETWDILDDELAEEK
ncbi:hypothetical protein F4X10_07755 [Candidatus Poribacteria bacterium]|nr:hypothetical protein [Candidatus Poribacteria bacterium]